VSGDLRPATDAELLERVNIGRRFEELANEPLLVRWFDTTQEIMVKCLLEADVRDDEEIKHWKQMIECRALIMKAFLQYIETGKITKDQLEVARHKKRPISRFKFGL
jgi:hypothetical protein